ncbi:MAG: hypothetical protein PHQ65_15700 [Bacteroidales bacterium]|nr:hypothetical protein [Bacteroidales bacterium]
MPLINNPKTIAYKKKRDEDIKKMFDDMASDHRTVEYIYKCICERYGLSEHTVNKIIKGYGKPENSKSIDKRQTRLGFAEE